MSTISDHEATGATTSEREDSTGAVPSEDIVCDNAHGEPTKIRLVKDPVCHQTGTFADVFEGQILQLNSNGANKEGSKIALKIMKQRKDDPKKIDFEKKFLREVTILRRLTAEKPHKNVIKLFYSRREEDNEQIVYTLIFPFIKLTLDHIAKDKDLNLNRNIVDIKLYTWQLFDGLRHLANLHIIHRDVKPKNLLVEHAVGRLYITDFGEVKYASEDTPSNFYAITRPYRPPELLLKSICYDCTVDIWSAGCILAELYLQDYLFYSSENNREQLQLIYAILGPPSREEIRAMHARIFVPLREPTVACPLIALSHKFEERGYREAENPAGILTRILRFDPRTRLHGRELLMDPFFNDIFEKGVRRTNGTFIADVISRSAISH